MAMRDYEELVMALRLCVKYKNAENALANARKAADAIEELVTVLCNWCGVCPKDKRNPNDCEIIESCMPEPPKEENDG